MTYGRKSILPVKFSIRTYPREPIKDLDLIDLVYCHTEQIYGKINEKRIEANLQIEKSQLAQQRYHDSKNKLESYGIGD